MTLTDHFGPITVHYDARVLAPRPWTVMQSEWAAELARDAPMGPLLELCAGAGQIGLAAAVLCDRDLVQIERDPVAAAFARSNARAAGRADRVDVRTAALDAVLAPDERFPVVLADPPYLTTDEVECWPADPPAAIDGGQDGLALVRTCLTVAAQHLVPGGHLLLQTAGPDQGDAVIELLSDRPFRHRGTRVVDDRRAVMHLARL